MDVSLGACTRPPRKELDPVQVNSVTLGVGWGYREAGPHRLCLSISLTPRAPSRALCGRLTFAASLVPIVTFPELILPGVNGSHKKQFGKCLRTKPESFPKKERGCEPGLWVASLLICKRGLIFLFISSIVLGLMRSNVNKALMTIPGKAFSRPHVVIKARVPVRLAKLGKWGFTDIEATDSFSGECFIWMAFQTTHSGKRWPSGSRLMPQQCAVPFALWELIFSNITRGISACSGAPWCR